MATTRPAISRDFKYGKDGIEKRRQCEKLRVSLWSERSSFDSHWAELSRFIYPRKARFQPSDNNKGGKVSQSIIDSTATRAAGICSAGMHAGVTSPARPWFNLGVADPDVGEQDDVKEWLHIVETRMQQAMVKSNWYKVLPVCYGDIAVFATGAFSIVEDPETIFRCYDFPLGTYACMNDERREVRTFCRVFRLTVGQIVRRWGNVDKEGKADFQRDEQTTLSVTVQQAWEKKEIATWIDLVHIVQPNDVYNGILLESKYKKFEEIYYEQGTDDGGASLLQHTGYDEFPVIVARWDKSGEDVYGTNCPGMTALGDVKQLQLMEKRGAQALEKKVNPPLVGPSDLVNSKVSVLPGDITYYRANSAENTLRPIYQVNFDLSELEAKEDQIRSRINSAFQADLFLMLADSDRRQITAREIDERHEEKLLAVGPTLENINDDILNPSIVRIFNIMERAGLFPDPPDSIQGTALVVRYVSIMAQAQRMIGLASLERTAGFVGQIAQYDPSVLDVVDTDQLVREHAEASGTPPKVLRSEDDISQMRAARAKAQQQQQAAENAPGISKALKNASETSTTGNDTVLGKMLGGQNARATLAATAGPPAALVA